MPRRPAGTVAAVVVAAVLTVAPAGAPPTRANDAAREAVVVSAAASLGPVLREITAAYESREPSRRVMINTAASGILMRQVERGAPVDLFLSASPVEVRKLEGQGLLRPHTKTVFAEGRLVVLVPRGTTPPDSLADLAGPAYPRIAVGNYKTVPAGRYAKEALETAGLWDRLQHRLIPAENARQVLDYVARAEVQAGLAYRTDARLLPDDVVEGPEVPPGTHSPILYVGAVAADAEHPKAARRLLSFMVSTEGRAILDRFGFEPPSR
jgi:molybdate transport system substrate-binding protein